MAAAIRCCCCGPPLKYRIRFGRSRHRCRFRYLASDTLYGKLLCCPLLCKRWSCSHQSSRCCSTKWDAVNVSLPNMTTLVLPPLCCCLTHGIYSLLPSLFSSVPIIWRLFCCPHSPTSLQNHFYSCLNRHVNPSPSST